MSFPARGGATQLKLLTTGSFANPQVGDVISFKTPKGFEAGDYSIMINRGAGYVTLSTGAATYALQSGDIPPIGGSWPLVGRETLGSLVTAATPLIKSPVAPDAPLIGTIYGGDGKININWAAPVYNGGSALTGYLITLSNGVTDTAAANATSKTVNTANGANITATVKAINSAGTSVASAASNPVSPAPGTYEFGATRLRVPNIYGTISTGFTYAIHESNYGSPDYDVTDPILHLAGWGGNNSMADCPIAGWKTTAGATASSNVFAFASIAGVQMGYQVTVQGAGAAGAALVGLVTAINGLNVTLDTAASTTVAAAYTVTTIAVTGSMTAASNIVTVTASAGMYIGQKLNIPGAGASGVALTGWIIGITDATHVTLGTSGVGGALNATTTVSNVAVNVISSVIDYFGAAIKPAGGSWSTVPGLSAATPLTIDANTMSNGGVTLPAITGVTITANTLYKVQLYFRTDAGAQVLPTIERNSTVDKVVASVDRTSTAQGSSSNLQAMFATDTLNGTHNGLSTIHCPAFIVAKRTDTRDVFLLQTDSIGYGKNDAATPNARFEIGFHTIGLDDNGTTKRLAFGHCGIPGTNPQQLSTATAWQFRLAALDSIKNVTGKYPFNVIMTNQGTNSMSTLLKGIMVTYFQYLRSRFPGVRIIQTELLARPTSTDGYQTLGNQTGAANDLYANRSTANGGNNSAAGARWDVNIAIGGPNGNADSTAEYRVAGYIDDSIAPWKYGSYDTAANRDKVKIRPTNALISGNAYTNGTLTLRIDVGASTVPIKDDTIIVYNSATATTALWDSTISSVTLVSGTVYDIGLAAAGTASAAIGNAVTCALHDRSGLHPGTYGHRSVYAQSVIDWKTARGYV